MGRLNHFRSGASMALFHGTNVELQPGEVIRPGNTPVTEGLSPQDPHRGLAFATESLERAASYANRASSRQGGNFRVYRVDPVADDVRHDGEGEYSSPSGFRVRRALPISGYQDPRVERHNERLQDYYESRGL